MNWKSVVAGVAVAAVAGTEILQAEAGAKPANCPAGSYWLNDKQMLASCDTSDVFGFAKISAGQKTASGQDFPTDSYLVQKDGMSMTDVSKSHHVQVPPRAGFRRPFFHATAGTLG